MTSTFTIPDQAVLFDTIQKNQDRFISYNIAHLRELIRYLSPEKFELFHTLPFLLHVNSKKFPGYVSDPDCRYGIYGFQDSGFWKLALRHFKYSEKALMPCMAKKYHIQGLYLMGSSGTLAQGEHSDLDYWVLVDEEMDHGPYRESLEKKLMLLEEWAGKTYHQQITFFVLTTNAVKNNTFQQVDEESSGTIQQTILKEEFYRTFIMIAGQIPYWAVIPDGLTRPQYLAWIHEAEKNRKLISEQRYIDLGYPDPINLKECPGALLWQVFKSQHDPVKSFIKASLIAAYFASPPGTVLPCDEIKKKFSDKKLDSYMVDPYSTIFNKTLAFYEKKKDSSRLEQLRECLFLRILGYPLVQAAAPGSPKDDLLRFYLDQWAWDMNRIERFRNYPNWPEPDKLDYEIRIISRISTLYKDIQQTCAHPDTTEIRSIRNRITTIFQTRPQKIPRCSAYVKARAESGKLTLAFRFAGPENQSWIIEEQNASGKKAFQRKLYTGSGLAQLTGWLHVNKLHLDPNRSIAVVPGDHFITQDQVRRFASRALAFLGSQDSPQDYSAEKPSWSHVLVAVEADPSGGNNNYERFDIILRNEWGEIFHHHMTLKNIENNMLKCYKLSHLLQTLLTDAPSRDPQYLILTLGAEDDRYAHRTTLEFLRQQEEALSGRKIELSETDDHPDLNSSGSENPFLDRL